MIFCLNVDVCVCLNIFFFLTTRHSPPLHSHSLIASCSFTYSYACLLFFYVVSIVIRSSMGLELKDAVLVLDEGIASFEGLIFCFYGVL